jgi:hypothetical protein
MLEPVRRPSQRSTALHCSVCNVELVKLVSLASRCGSSFQPPVGRVEQLARLAVGQRHNFGFAAARQERWAVEHFLLSLSVALFIFVTHC